VWISRWAEAIAAAGRGPGGSRRSPTQQVIAGIVARNGGEACRVARHSKQLHIGFARTTCWADA